MTWPVTARFCLQVLSSCLCVKLCPLLDVLLRTCGVTYRQMRVLHAPIDRNNDRSSSPPSLDRAEHNDLVSDVGNPLQGSSSVQDPSKSDSKIGHVKPWECEYQRRPSPKGCFKGIHRGSTATPTAASPVMNSEARGTLQSPSGASPGRPIWRTNHILNDNVPRGYARTPFFFALVNALLGEKSRESRHSVR